MKKIVILISGRGSNMVAIARACAAEGWPARIVGVIGNRPGAEGLARAAELGLPVRVLDHREHPDRESFDAALSAEIDALAPDLVVLAGFMRILTDGFVRRYAGRMLNIHPSLLPSFAGRDGIGDALAHGVRVTGCTVHLVEDAIDSGPIVGQTPVEVRDDDTRETLAARIHAAEHALFPEAVRRYVSDPWRLEGRRIVFGEGPGLVLESGRQAARG